MGVFYGHGYPSTPPEEKSRRILAIVRMIKKRMLPKDYNPQLHGQDITVEEIQQALNSESN